MTIGGRSLPGATPQDGGDTWEDWSGTISDYTECICVQPSQNGSEIVYLFTTSRGGSAAGVYYRTEGMSVNLALPFFRDGKIRVGGNCGVWESELLEPDFEPVVNPWVMTSFSNCMHDTFYFDDHSILNHDGAGWTWSITPEPLYIEDIHLRNPMVIPGSPGSYTVTLTVEQNGQTYSKTVTDMITVSTCPSIYDCNNPATIPKDDWELLYVDSEETIYPGLAVMSFDDDNDTFWQTRWSTGSDPYPHEIRIDLGDIYRIYAFTYLPKQEGASGRIRNYELYISRNEIYLGDPVSAGSFVGTPDPETIEFPAGVIGRYFRFRALSELSGFDWAAAAEFSLVGCKAVADHPPEGARKYPLQWEGDWK